MDDSRKTTRIEILLLFALYIVFLPRVYMTYDMGFWTDWALYIHQHGLSSAYNSTINYFPVYLYCLYLYDLLQGTAENIVHNINNLKLFFVFFDFLPVFVLCFFRQKIFSFRIPYLYLLLNIAYIFNSMMWGQMDAIHTNLAFLAIVIGIVYPVPAAMLYLLALNAKPQAIEFLPVVAVVLLYSIKSIRTVATIIISACALQFVLLIPFISTGGVGKLLYIATHAVDLYNKLSISAFNFWYIVARGNPYFINDKDTFILFSYKTIGLSLFCIAALAAWVPLFRKFRQLKKDALAPDKYAYELLFLSAGMICLYFFYFNVQMHERYAHPIIILFFFYSVVSGDYKLYILASIPYFLSLDKCFPDYLPIVHYKIIFASRIIAIWYTITVVYGSSLLYRLVKRGKVELLTPGNADQ